MDAYLTPRFKAGPSCPFTRKQLPCVLWAAEGKAADEIALIVSADPEKPISTSMVRKHLRSASERLNAGGTLRELIAESLHRGAIEVRPMCSRELTRWRCALRAKLKPRSWAQQFIHRLKQWRWR